MRQFVHILKLLYDLFKSSFLLFLLLPGMPVPIVIANVAIVSKDPHFGVYKQNDKTY